jgi:predicted ATPase
MLKHIDIQAYKCLENCQLPLQALTLLTGPNSSGKSTVIQAILIALSSLEQKNQIYLDEVVKPYSQYDEVVCRWATTRVITIRVFFGAAPFGIEISHDSIKTTNDSVSIPLQYEESFFYLSANRLGPEDISELNKKLCIGPKGQWAFGYLEQHKDKPLHDAICHAAAPSKTLKAQLAYWLTFIVGISVEARTQKITATSVKTSFNVGVIEDISPFNTGAGNSYLLKLLIMCLTCKPGDVLLIENPEIHLHPGAQARLGAFLAYLAARGVQVVAETHCEHLINRIRFEIYQDKLNAHDVVIHYKANEKSNFETLLINQSGHFVDSNGVSTTFPAGFFDSTLRELLEIG